VLIWTGGSAGARMPDQEKQDINEQTRTHRSGAWQIIGHRSRPSAWASPHAHRTTCRGLARQGLPLPGGGRRQGWSVKGIVLRSCPFSLLSQTKPRPVLVLAASPGNDLILRQITRQARKAGSRGRLARIAAPCHWTHAK